MTRAILAPRRRWCLAFAYPAIPPMADYARNPIAEC